MAGKRADDELPIEEAVDRLEEAEARRLLVSAAEYHEDVSRAVRLATADEDDRLAMLKAAVDSSLRTRRHLDYRGSMEWAREASPVIDALGDAVATEPSADLVVLLQRAAGHLVKVIMRADDSSGVIGDLTSRVLELHREVCAAGVAEPKKLAKWMVRFTFEDQDFFEIDPVAYAEALGDEGLVVYRREVAKPSEPEMAPADRPLGLRELHGDFPSFAAKYAAERLAVMDRDVDRLVDLLGGDLSAPYQFLRVAEAMIEFDLDDEALAWARRGIDETSGWQVAKLYDLAADLLRGEGRLDDVVELRRHHHERAPTSSTYAALQTAARANGTWEAEVAPARAALAERDLAGLIDALLADGEPERAWDAAAAGSVGVVRSPG